MIQDELERDKGGTGNAYVEVQCNPRGDRLRVTLVDHAYAEGDLGPSIRVQIVRLEGGPLPGPEFIANYLPDVINALARIGIELRERAER